MRKEHVSYVVDRRLIEHVFTNKKKFLYENELIDDWNDYNVNKQICIFWFQRVNWYDF